ncbi:DUF4157 domain-containing protein [Pseudomonas gingeri]|uniref:eCIS core domain-containing protein n=1 Tax=Pseudomonas gingeri TaxID=117681 RepID=UPI0015A2FAF7|nr:DUF4157 domain-containing protein [Pseudomonas gingeri]NVZ67254.1 DUF4157 domain-containing protein [Pseudomonas gingeri]
MKNFDFNYLLRSSRALTIPTETLKKLERLFLSDLSGLRVCECSLPNDFIALASGTIVLIAPGFFRPGTMKGDAILAHEISHLFQQQSDPVTCSDENGVFIDRQLEIEADFWATLSIFSVGLAPELPRAYNHLPTENQGMVAQTWIKMAIETGDSTEKKGASEYKPALRFGGS